MTIEPFSIPYSQAAVDDLRDRLAQTRWPDQIPGSGWEYGANLDFSVKGKYTIKTKLVATGKDLLYSFEYEVK